MPFQNGSFDDATLAVLQRAFDEACREAGVEEKPAEAPWNVERRAKMAAAIVELAAAGELNPRILKERAVSQLILIR